MITPEILDATDQDTDESIITFTLTSLPAHGELHYDDQPMALGRYRCKCCFRNNLMYLFVMGYANYCLVFLFDLGVCKDIVF